MKRLSFILLGVILFVIFGLVFVNLYPDYLWFKSFKFQDVWWFRVKFEWITWSIFTLFAFLWLYLNVYIANKNSSIASSQANYTINTPFKFLNVLINSLKANWEKSSIEQSMKTKTLSLLINVVVVVLAMFFGLSAKSWWEDLFLYLNQSAYGLTDPVFGQDISFYMFSLPLFNQIQNWFVGLFVVSIIFVGWIYLSRNILLVIFSKDGEFSGIKKHLICLLSLTFILFALGTFLSAFELLFSSNNVVYGASYVDLTIILPIKYMLIALFLLEAILVLLLISRSLSKSPYIVLLLIVLLHVVGLKFLPSVVQSAIVDPNQFELESKYIESSIAYTQEAYDLNDIKIKDFPAKNDLSKDDLKQNSVIVENIRLWNQEPLKSTFSQLQEIRLYYEFVNVDVDRYLVNGKPQQVMLSAREVNVDKLESQTWTNKHLVYTHGYGLCMTPVNQITSEGLPEFYIKDLPPKASEGLSVTRPEIYFGEKTFNYVIANSKQDEFDFPKGDSNVYTHYEGHGGIELNSLFRRIMFSMELSDWKILLSTQIKPDSKLIYDRTVLQMVKKIAPFLVYDQDPYLVLTDAGRLKWVLDGYTYSSSFPYSENYGRINYIRDTVKIVVDAYDGDVDFYIIDEEDPLINAYSRVYKGMFKDIEDMPISIQKHVKYPKDLFSIQAYMLNKYHMNDTRVFYNREDMWVFPEEKYEGQEKIMDPYYIVTKLPEQDKESFVLMLPFTPFNKENMIAWLAASSDLDTYGEFTLLRLPKDKTIYGPKQIETLIDQDTEISQKLTLWNQEGSSVIRGNLMIIPIDESLLYVEPIYLQADTSKLPSLKRVIVAYGDKVVMEENLVDAIYALFGFKERMKRTVDADGVGSSTTFEYTGEHAILVDIFMHLKQSLSDQRWVDFGKTMEELESAINQLQQEEVIE